MSVSVTCPCGARFDAPPAFAGQAVACPECHAPVAVPSARRPLRTSGYAVASVVLALVLMFTVVGTVVAAVLGVVALVSISRNRDRLAGTGYAVAGIVLGVVFTGLTAFALSRAELFDPVRERIRGDQLDRGGPLEVVREEEGYAITRPTAHWGVDRSRAKRDDPSADLLLVNVGKDAYVEVSVQEVGAADVGRCREDLIAEYRDKPLKELFGRTTSPAQREFRLRDRRSLPPLGKARVEEFSFDIRLSRFPFTFLIRLVKEEDGRLYVLRAWALRRNFTRAEAEIRQAMDSFRLLEEKD